MSLSPSYRCSASRFTKVAAVRTALEGEDVDAVKSAAEELQQALHRVGDAASRAERAVDGSQRRVRHKELAIGAVYKQDTPGDEGPQAPEDGSGPRPDDTVEGEYREV